jgi:hypothetical protein
MRIKSKNYYGERYGKRGISALPRVDLVAALQNLFEKFSAFSEDNTILSFKEVKGFLRETFSELKKFLPAA